MKLPGNVCTLHPRGRMLVGPVLVTPVPRVKSSRPFLVDCLPVFKNDSRGVIVSNRSIQVTAVVVPSPQVSKLTVALDARRVPCVHEPPTGFLLLAKK